MTISAVPDYVIVGHVIKDKVADGYRLGGTVSFAGAVVQALGGSLGIVSAAAADGRALALQQFPGAEFSWVKSEETTVYENIYSASGRVQYCLSLADKLSVADFPEAVSYTHQTLPPSDLV